MPWTNTMIMEGEEVHNKNGSFVIILNESAELII